jgi:hypothetical protein
MWSLWLSRLSRGLTGVTALRKKKEKKKKNLQKNKKKNRKRQKAHHIPSPLFWSKKSHRRTLFQQIVLPKFQPTSQAKPELPRTIAIHPTAIHTTALDVSTPWWRHAIEQPFGKQSSPRLTGDVSSATNEPFAAPSPHEHAAHKLTTHARTHTHCLVTEINLKHRVKAAPLEQRLAHKVKRRLLRHCEKRKIVLLLPRLV